MIDLVLPAPKDEHLSNIVEWLNNSVLMSYSEQRHLKHSIDTQRYYVSNILARFGFYYLVYCNNTIVGSVSAHVDHKNGIADAGVLIGSEYTGKGHGCEAWRIFCEQLAKEGIRKIEGGCMAQNKAMLRIFEKNGMRLEGTRRYHFQTGKDQYDDMVLYGKLT